MKISVTELPLAASLQVLGFIPDLEVTSTNKFIFIFPETIEVKTAISSYWSNKLKINPKLLWSNVRELKSRMSSFEPKQRGGRNV